MLQDPRAPWLNGCTIKPDGSNIVDLSHDWHEGMEELPFFPPMKQQPFHTHERDGILSSINHLSESCGTHCEAPGHIIPGAPTIDQIPLSGLIGPAAVVDVRAQCAANPDYKLSIEDLTNWEKRHGRIPDKAWLVMQSGWSARWGTPGFLNLDANSKDHYPGFEPSAARWLVENDRHIVGIATECFSPEGGTASRSGAGSVKSDGRAPRLPVRQELLPVWHTLVLSNLANTATLPEVGAWLMVGVIHFKGGSGGQARVFGVTPAV
jgi:kynurenine formamidase